jgi:DNA-binding transcriptional ArsR family regulator
MIAFSALSDPTRRQIIEMLARGERAAGEISDEFDVSPQAISQHLKVLREARLVRVRVQAQRRIYEIDPDGFAEVDEWLNRVRRFWGTRLDALEREVRRRSTGPRRKK